MNIPRINRLKISNEKLVVGRILTRIYSSKMSCFVEFPSGFQFLKRKFNNTDKIYSVWVKVFKSRPSKTC